MESNSSSFNNEVLQMESDSIISSTPIKLSKTNDITLIKGWRNKQFNVNNSKSDFIKSRNVTLLCDDLKNYINDEPLMEERDGINIESLRIVLANDFFKEIGQKIKNSSNSELIKNLGKKMDVDDLDGSGSKLSSETMANNTTKDVNNCRSNKLVDLKDKKCSKNDKLNAFVNKTVNTFLCNDSPAIQQHENSVSPSSVKGKSPSRQKNDSECESSSSNGSSYIYVPRIPIKTSNVVTIVCPIFDAHGRKPKTVYEKRRLLEGHLDESEPKKLKTQIGGNESLRHFQYIGRHRKFDNIFRKKNAGRVLKDKFVNSSAPNGSNDDDDNKTNKMSSFRVSRNSETQLYKKFSSNKLRGVELKTKKTGDIGKKFSKKGKVRKLKKKNGKFNHISKNPVYVKPLARRLGPDTLALMKKHLTNRNILDNYNRNRKVLMVLYLGLGRSLYQEQLRNMNLLKKRDPVVIDSAWANFSASAVLDKNNPRKLTPLVVPVVCPMLIAFMERYGSINSRVNHLDGNVRNSLLAIKENNLITDDVTSKTHHNLNRKKGVHQDVTKNSQLGCSTLPKVSGNKNKPDLKKRLLKPPVRDEIVTVSTFKNNDKTVDFVDMLPVVEDSVNTVIEDVILRSQDNMYNTNNIHNIISEMSVQTQTCEGTGENIVLTDTPVVDEVATDSTRKKNSIKTGNSNIKVVDKFISQTQNSNIQACRPFLNAWRRLGKKKKKDFDSAQVVDRAAHAHPQVGVGTDENNIPYEKKKTDNENLNISDKSSHKSLSEIVGVINSNGKATEFDAMSLASSDISDNSPTKKYGFGNTSDKMTDSDSLSQISQADTDTSENTTTKKLNFRKVASQNRLRKYTGKSCRVARELRRLNSDYLELDNEIEGNSDSPIDARESAINNFISPENSQNLIPDDITQRLAKVEKEYHQTVMKSNDGLIFLSSYGERNKRIRRRPRRLQEDALLDESEFVKPVEDSKRVQDNNLLNMDEISSIIQQRNIKETILKDNSNSYKIKSNMSSSDSLSAVGSLNNIDVYNSLGEKTNKIGVPVIRNEISPEKLINNRWDKSNKLKLKDPNVLKNMLNGSTSDMSISLNTDRITELDSKNQIVEENEFLSNDEDTPLSERLSSIKEANQVVQSTEKSEFSILKNKNKSNQIKFITQTNQQIKHSDKDKTGRKVFLKNSNIKLYSSFRRISRGRIGKQRNLLRKPKKQKYRNRVDNQNNLKSGTGTEFNHMNNILGNIPEKLKPNEEHFFGREMKSDFLQIDVNRVNELGSSTFENRSVLKSNLRLLGSASTSVNRENILEIISRKVNTDSNSPQGIKSKSEPLESFKRNPIGDSKTINSPEAARKPYNTKETTILVETSKSILKPNFQRNNISNKGYSPRRKFIEKKNPYVLLERLKLPAWCKDYRQYSRPFLQPQRKRCVAVKRVCPMYYRYEKHNKNYLQQFPKLINHSDIKNKINNDGFKYVVMAPIILHSDTVGNNNSEDQNVQFSENLSVANLNPKKDVRNSPLMEGKGVNRIEEIILDDSSDSEKLRSNIEENIIVNQSSNQSDRAMFLQIEDIKSLKPEEFYTDINDCPEPSLNGSDMDLSNFNGDKENNTGDIMSPNESDVIKPENEKVIRQYSEKYRFFCIYMNCRFTYIKFIGGPTKNAAVNYNLMFSLIVKACEEKKCFYRPLQKSDNANSIKNNKMQFGFYAVPGEKVIFFGPYGTKEDHELEAYKICIEYFMNKSTGKTRHASKYVGVPFITPSIVKDYTKPHVQGQWWYVNRNRSSKQLFTLLKDASVLPKRTSSASSSPVSILANNTTENESSNGRDPTVFVPLNQSTSSLIPNQMNLRVLDKKTNIDTNLNMKSEAKNNDRLLTVSKKTVLDPSALNTITKCNGSTANVKFLSGVVTKPVTTTPVKSVSNSRTSKNIGRVLKMDSIKVSDSSAFVTGSTVITGERKGNSITKTVSTSETRCSTLVPLAPKTSSNNSATTVRKDDGTLIRAHRKSNTPVLLNVLPDGKVVTTALYQFKDKNKVYNFYKTTTGSSITSTSTQTSSAEEKFDNNINASKTIVNTGASMSDESTKNSVICTQTASKYSPTIRAYTPVNTDTINSSTIVSDIFPETALGPKIKYKFKSDKKSKSDLRTQSLIKHTKTIPIETIADVGKDEKTLMREVKSERKSSDFSSTDTPEPKRSLRIKKKLSLLKPRIDKSNISTSIVTDSKTGNNNGSSISSRLSPPTLSNSKQITPDNKLSDHRNNSKIHSDENKSPPSHVNDSASSTIVSSVHDDKSSSLSTEPSEVKTEVNCRSPSTLMTSVAPTSPSVSLNYQAAGKLFKFNGEQSDQSKDVSNHDLSPDFLASFGIHFTNDI